MPTVAVCVYPPLKACALYVLKLFGIIYVSLLVFVMVANGIKGRPLLGSAGDDLALVVGVFVALPILATLAIYGAARLWAWSIDAAGIRGRSYWGRRVAIGWTDVDEVDRTSVEGIPALVIHSARGGDVFAYLLGVDAARVQARLRKLAGPAHALTQAFDASAA